MNATPSPGSGRVMRSGKVLADTGRVTNNQSTKLEWIPKGERFSFLDLTTWHGKGNVPFSKVAPGIRTIIFSPHGGVAFPEELLPFVNNSFTRRAQFDFSDVSGSTVGKAWAQMDPTVVFIENKHSRLVTDPNRPKPASVGSGSLTPAHSCHECLGGLVDDIVHQKPTPLHFTLTP